MVKRADTGPDREADRDRKKPYRSPELAEYGPLAKLTRAGAGAFPDGGVFPDDTSG